MCSVLKSLVIWKNRSNMDVVTLILEKSSSKSSKFKSVTVNKLLDVECDVGSLLVVDTNELDKRLLA